MDIARTRGVSPAAMRLELIEGGACLRLDRAPVNAFTADMFGQFCRLLTELGRDPRPVLIAGANGIFSAGFDIKQGSADAASANDAARRCLAAVQAHPAPVVVAVEGAAVGFGLLLACSADLLVISRTARVRMPEVTLGVVADVAPLRRFVTEPWVRRLCLLGQGFPAEQLHLEVAGAMASEPGEAEARARAVIASFAGIGPESLAATKLRLSE